MKGELRQFAITARTKLDKLVSLGTITAISKAHAKELAAHRAKFRKIKFNYLFAFDESYLYETIPDYYDREESSSKENGYTKDGIHFHTRDERKTTRCNW